MTNLRTSAWKASFQRNISYFHLTYFSFALLFFYLLLPYKRFDFLQFFIFFFCDPTRDLIRDPIRDPVRDLICDPVQVLSTPQMHQLAN